MTSSPGDSHRREFLFGAGADFVAGNGSVVDVRFGLVITAWRRGLREGDFQRGSYPPDAFRGHGFRDDDGDRCEATFHPRIRVRFGWARKDAPTCGSWSKP